MTATLRNVAGNYGQDANGQLTFSLAQLTSKFSDDDAFLIMEKVLGGDGCTQIEVDGVTVCSEVDETITLQCKYSLADRTIDDTYQVTGQDTAATAEGTGTLDYNLVVEDNKAIGDEITFTINPVNANLVFATVKECHVTKDSQELTIIGHGVEHCLNPVVNAKAITDLFSSQSTIQGSWTAFKWSTAESDNVESQGLKCKIGLSQAKSTDAVSNCVLAN